LSSFVIVGDLDLVGISVFEKKADPLSLIDSHRPLSFAIAFQFVKTNALERAEVIEPLRDVESQQQIDRRIKIQTAELIGSFAFPNLTARRIAPRADHV